MTITAETPEVLGGGEPDDWNEGDSLAGHPRFRDLVDRATGPVGRVVGSEKEPAGGHAFAIWVTEEARSLDTGHIVVAFSEEAAVIGVLDEARRFSDLKSFLDDYFDRMGEEEPASTVHASARPEILVYTVSVLATKHLRDDVDSQRPPVGGPVWFATEAALDYALGVSEFSGVKIPVLMHTNGNAKRGDDGEPLRDAAGNVRFQQSPIYLDSDYLLGPEAGHANWTGQSGLATKTSHALFLTAAAFQTMRRAAKPKSVAALMFNVKGADLLWLDKPVVPPEGMDEAYAAADVRGLSADDLEAYAALGLDPVPFDKLRIFAPFTAGSLPNGATVSLSQTNAAGVLDTQRSRESEATGVVFPIAWELGRLLAMPHRVFEYGDLDDKMFGFIAELRAMQVTTVKQFEAKIDEILAWFNAPENAAAARDGWEGHNKMTILKARNRIQGLVAKFGGLLAEGNVAQGSVPLVDGPFEDQEVRVVDIAGCNSNVQEVLVSSVVTSLWRLAEQKKLGVDKVIVFVDELNKYAPGGSESALRDTLVDIAARGRHLNVVLFGAQQFRSKVDDEILGNCGTSLYGRVGDEEIVNSAYRSLTEGTKQELLGLKKGRLLVRHAHFRTPLFGRFPRRACLDGIQGVEIFNLATANGPREADGLWRALKAKMGDRAPSLRDVRAAADGFDRRDLEKIIGQVQNMAFAPPRSDPWRTAQRLLSEYRS